MSVNLTIHSTGTGSDALTGKDDCDGLTVSFEDGTIDHLFLSWKSFRQLLNLKTQGQGSFVKPIHNGSSDTIVPTAEVNEAE